MDCLNGELSATAPSSSTRRKSQEFGIFEIFGPFILSLYSDCLNGELPEFGIFEIFGISGLLNRVEKM